MAVIISAHRNGCLQQRSYLYAALREIGYTILSDVEPELNIPVHYAFVKETRRLCGADNSNIPLTARPWRHDIRNWKDWRSKRGHFLHIPVTYCNLPLYPVPLGRYEKVCRGKGDCFPTFDFHPYEIQDRVTGNVDHGKVASLRKQIKEVKKRFKPEFIHIYRAAEIRDSQLSADQ